jgi:AcrR family transcriptional regulator
VADHAPSEPAPGVPEPPWLRKRPGSAREHLSRDAIVEAALRVLARKEPRPFTMRAVAEELGTGAGALYWHVADKEQLVQLVFDRVVAELPRPEPDPERWQEQLKQTARDALALMRRYPGVAQLSLGRVPLGPNAVRHIEWYLSLLRAGGLPDRAVALAADLVFLYVGAFACEECLWAARSEAEASSEELTSELRAYFCSLPADAFPTVVELADDLTTPGPDERFEFGLELLVDGLAAQRR